METYSINDFTMGKKINQYLTTHVFYLVVVNENQLTNHEVQFTTSS